MTRERTSTTAGSAEHLWSALQIAAVAGILILGAVLKSNATISPSRPAPVADLQPPPVEATPDLAGRVQADVRRLLAAGPGFTAQLAVLCDSARAERLVREFGAHAELYVLPTFHGDAPCFLFSWNHYANRQAAQEARDLPAGLRRIQQDPVVRTTDEVLR